MGSNQILTDRPNQETKEADLQQRYLIEELELMKILKNSLEKREI